jgi:hypothetical protein
MKQIFYLDPVPIETAPLIRWHYYNAARFTPTSALLNLIELHYWPN